MRKIVMKWHMDLYHLDRASFCSCLDKAPQNIKFVYITEANLESNKDYHSEKHNLWKRNLKKGSVGIFALCDGVVVGHGWLKKRGAVDSFYRVGKDVAYLSEFFVSSEFRGKSIYPALLSQLILAHPSYDEFYISAYKSNVASRNGLLKVGFKPIRDFCFVRALKITFNKHKLVSCFRRDR